jgi:hypothetical protein
MHHDLEFDLEFASFENHGLEHVDKSSLEPNEPSLRAKTSLRMHYEAQVAVIQKQTGGLEQIRSMLGLSQRKMAQLLLVDPSSWTRWVKGGDSVPPHVWRSIQWYLALREKIPGLTSQYFLSSTPESFHQKALKELELERSERTMALKDLKDELGDLSRQRVDLQLEIESLRKDLNFYRKTSILIILTCLTGFIGLIFWKTK